MYKEESICMYMYIHTCIYKYVHVCIKQEYKKLKNMDVNKH